MSTRFAIVKSPNCTGRISGWSRHSAASSGLQSQRMSDRDRDDAARAEAERADRTYNDALTGLDAAIIPPGDDQGPILPWPDAVLPPPGGLLKPWLRVIHRWLAPVFARQRTFDNNVIEAMEVLSGRGRDRAVAFARFQTA